LIYLKSVVVGLVAVVMAVIATALAIIVFLAIKGRHLPPNQTYAWDSISFFQSSLAAWVFLSVAFLLGFAWEYPRTIAGH
jgi:hypothetical protein